MNRLVILATVALSLVALACGDDSPSSKSGSGGENNATGNNAMGNNNATDNNGENNAGENNASNGGENNASNTSGNNANTANNAGENNNAQNISASDYDQVCMFDYECAVVHEGDPCLCGGSACGNAGIATDDLERWTADRDEACPPGLDVCTTEPCPDLRAACFEGTCRARERDVIDTSSWDKSCAADTDCALIYEGDPCSACMCWGTAVNVSERERFEAIIAGRECNPGPSPCDCIDKEAWCNVDQCEARPSP